MRAWTAKQLRPLIYNVRSQMINYNKYILYFLAATTVSVLCLLLGQSKGQVVNLWIFSACCVFSMFYVPFVVIKLPVFNKYYTTDSFKINKTHHNYANWKAAPVMVGLATGLTLSLFLFLLDQSSIGYHGFLGGTFSTVISLYYEPSF